MRSPARHRDIRGRRRPGRFTLLAALALLLAVAPPGAVTARADDSSRTGGGADEISLEDQLKTGLKARRPEEVEFIEDVVRAVNAGALPRKVVESTYIWAVRRRQTWPYPAFERALRIRADLLGVNL